jgi:hypothetical protein
MFVSNQLPIGMDELLKLFIRARTISLLRTYEGIRADCLVSLQTSVLNQIALCSAKTWTAHRIVRSLLG